MELEESLPVMLWSARADMSCEHVNRAWLEFTGLAAEQALGEGWSRVVHAEDLAHWLDSCVRAFDARELFEIEYRMRRHDGAYRWVLDRAVPRYSAEGAFIGYAGACIDIDERKRAEDALARALERERRLRSATEEAGRAKDGLLASVLAERDAPLLAGVRVLVIEDDAAVREALVDMLSVAGAETRSAASSAEALDTLEAWRPDVMLSDTDARGGQGCVQLRAMTDGQRAVVSGYDAQLAKPVEPVALLATVARLVHA